MLYAPEDTTSAARDCLIPSCWPRPMPRPLRRTRRTPSGSMPAPSTLPPTASSRLSRRSSITGTKSTTAPWTGWATSRPPPATLFPPGGAPSIKAAATPAEIAHGVVAGGNLPALNLGDKEFILANGSKEDADQLWAVMKDQVTPVPGVVIEASASVIKVAVSDDAKATKRPTSLST